MLIKPDILDLIKKRERKYLVILVIILAFKVLGFSTITNSPAIAKVLKIIIGLSMTTWITMFQIKLNKKKGYVASHYNQNLFILWLYMGFLFWGFCSLAWSSDVPYSTIQLVRDIDYLVFSILFIRVIMTLQFYHPDSKLRFAKILGWAIMLNALIFLIGNYADPGTYRRLTHGGDVERLGGYIMNPNELGMMCSLGMVCFLMEFKSRRNIAMSVICILLCLWTMFLTGSRSSLIGFFLVCGIVVKQYGTKWVKIGAIVAGSFVVPMAAQEVIFNEEKGGLEEVMSMTGRLPFWTALLTEALPHEPVQGFGFMCIYYTHYFQGRDTYPASMTHNTFIQVLMSLGFVGGIIVIFQMACTFRGAIREPNLEWKYMFWVGFIPLFINSLTEFGIWGETNYGVIFYQLIFLLLVVRFNPRFTPNEVRRIKKGGLWHLIEHKVVQPKVKTTS